MSRVMLIAADRPLPLQSRRTERSVTSKIGGEEFTVGCAAGFAVTEHAYYRSAVDELGLSMAPCQYELSLEEHEDDLADLRSYLKDVFAAGDKVELWNLWVGAEPLGKVPHYRGSLNEFDMEALSQFVKPPHEDGGVGQCCMTVLI